MEKKKVFEHIKALLDERIQISYRAMQSAQESANEEGKSSAGDKYETGRAMAQIERDKYAKQYQLGLNGLVILDKIRPEQGFSQVGLGSLVYTSIGWIFVAISLGIIKIDEEPIMVISPQSPLGIVILGKKVNEKFGFREKQCEILEIL